jgi:BCD family chlorophyll transporter-like MFS transporter
MTTSGQDAAANSTGHGFSLPRTIKLGSFHIGSSMSDLISSAVWNRIMIVDIGVVAWPVALLSALRYFLAPLTLWAGHLSDTHPILGSRRVAYIWLGRSLMLMSLPLLPLSTVIVAEKESSTAGWLLALVSFLLYGVGTLISGAPFLALVHDSAPYDRRGQAISIVQIMLVVSFAFIPAVYARLMPTYDAESFRALVLISIAGAAFFWVFSVWGEEHRNLDAAPRASAEPFSTTFRMLWGDRSARRYAGFLAASAFFAFIQDAVLEPFGGDVFDLAAGATTRFNAFWGTGVVVGMVGTIVLTRRRRPDQQVATTALGLALTGAPLLLLALAATAERLALVMPALVAFGFGFGVFTVGGVSLLMAMTADEQAGAYLALWSVIQLVARGAGIAAGGLLRDVALSLSGMFSTAYAAIFLIEALGLWACIGLLRRIDVPGFAASRRLSAAHEGTVISFD